MLFLLNIQPVNAIYDYSINMMGSTFFNYEPIFF